MIGLPAPAGSLKVTCHRVPLIDRWSVQAPLGGAAGALPPGLHPPHGQAAAQRLSGAVHDGPGERFRPADHFAATVGGFDGGVADPDAEHRGPTVLDAVDRSGQRFDRAACHAIGEHHQHPDRGAGAGHPLGGVDHVELVDVGRLLEHRDRRARVGVALRLHCGLSRLGGRPEQPGEDVLSVAPAAPERLHQVVVHGGDEPLRSRTLALAKPGGGSGAARRVPGLGVGAAGGKGAVEQRHLELDLKLVTQPGQRPCAEEGRGHPPWRLGR